MFLQYKRFLNNKLFDKTQGKFGRVLLFCLRNVFIITFIGFIAILIATRGDSKELFRQVRGKNPSPQSLTKVDFVADYLRQNLKTGETVQPLDWTSGALQAMLAVKAECATSFVFDFQF